MMFWGLSFPTTPLAPKRKLDKTRYPQTCKCGADAYIGAYDHKCTSPDCQHYVEPQDSDYLPDEPAGKKSDFDDEPTQPGVQRKMCTAIGCSTAGPHGHFGKGLVP